MRIATQLLRGVALTILVIAAPGAIAAAEETEVCQIRWNWYGYQCVSCAEYEDGCQEWTTWEYACCQTTYVDGSPEVSCYMGGGEQAGCDIMN